MDKDEIKKLLPHREPFLMVDKVVSHTDTQIECELFLDETLPFFKGHFPNQPIMPGVLTCEALAQTGGILLALKNGKNGKIFYLASANMKYLKVARPPDTLKLCAKIVRSFNGLFQFSATAFVDAEKVAEGTIVLAVPKNAQ